MALNDNWQHTIIGGIITENQVRDIQDSGHAPGDPRESAIIADLPDDNYTMIVRGVDNATGVALWKRTILAPKPVQFLATSVLAVLCTRTTT